jgi:hypothetical protein
VPVDERWSGRDWGDFWARADECRVIMGAGGLAFTQEQIKDEIAQGRL